MIDAANGGLRSFGTLAPAGGTPIVYTVPNRHDAAHGASTSRVQTIAKRIEAVLEPRGAIHPTDRASLFRFRPTYGRTTRQGIFYHREIPIDFLGGQSE